MGKNKSLTRNLRKAIRRGHWITILQVVLWLGFMVFIFFIEFSVMESFTGCSNPIVNKFPRW